MAMASSHIKAHAGKIVRKAKALVGRITNGSQPIHRERERLDALLFSETSWSVFTTMHLVVLYTETVNDRTS